MCGVTATPFKDLVRETTTSHWHRFRSVLEEVLRRDYLILYGCPQSLQQCIFFLIIKREGEGGGTSPFGDIPEVQIVLLEVREMTSQFFITRLEVISLMTLIV